MATEHTQTPLSTRDIELVVSVLDCAWRNGWSVAEVIRHRLTQNEVALSMSLEDGDDDAYRMITAETRRIERLQRRFASWRAADSAEHLRPEAQRHAGVSS
jgi:hypothetical protein